MELGELKPKLNIDYDDDDVDLQFYMDAAQAYIDKSVGEGYKTDDKLIKISELALQKLVSDMYNNKSAYISAQVKKDNIIGTIFSLLGNATELVEE